MKILDKTMVTLTYDLYVPTEDNKEELMESATSERPLIFCYGLGQMLPKFESNLAGLAEGDEFDFTIDCADAYGERSEDAVLDLERSIFEVDGKFDSENIAEGKVVPLMNADGQRFNASIISVGQKVKVDLNHPLAGEDLHFKGHIVDAHEATKEELDSFTHHCNEHCGGDCDGGCGDHCGEGEECGHDCNCKG